MGVIPGVGRWCWLGVCVVLLWAWPAPLLLVSLHRHSQCLGSDTYNLMWQTDYLTTVFHGQAQRPVSLVYTRL